MKTSHTLTRRVSVTMYWRPLGNGPTAVSAIRGLQTASDPEWIRHGGAREPARIDAGGSTRISERRRPPGLCRSRALPGR